MYLSIFSDEELQQWIKRVSKWLSYDEKNKINSELERRGLKTLGPIEKPRIEEKAREEAKKAREERQKELERDWRKQGCVKDSSGNWKVPYSTF
jgi:hypothetical protein